MKLILVWLMWLAMELLLIRDLTWTIDFFLGKRFLVNFGLSSLAFLLILSFLRGLNGFKKRLTITLFITLAVVLQGAYFSIYKKFISVFGVSFFFSEPSLTLALWWQNINLIKVIITALLSVGLLFWVFRLQSITRLWRWLNGTLLAVILFAAWFSWYASPTYQNSVIAFYGNVVGLAQKWHYQSLSPTKPNHIPQHKPIENAANIVWIIGESLNLHQMSLYGYARKTTPNLDALYQQGRLFKFNNVSSIGNKTRSSVPYLLKGLQGPDPKGRIYQYPDIFDYAKANGYQTAIISAQDWRWGELDQLFVDGDVDIFENGDSFSPNVRVSKGADDLVVLEKGISPFLAQAKKPFLLLVQMDGSHYPYNEHSPAAYKKFLPEKQPNDINAYDNTVVYSDVYLAGLIKKISSEQPNSWVFFAPDHGQNLRSSSSAGFFNDGYSEDVIRSPMFIIPPETTPEVIKTTLKKNQNAPISQADIFATILAIKQIKAVKAIDGYSLLSPIAEDRLRITSADMVTFFNDGTAVVILPDFSYYAVDFERGSVTLPDGIKTIRYEDFRYRHLFDDRR